MSIIATDLDIIFYDEISDVKILKEGSTTTSAAILYDILRKISSNSELNFELKSENKLSLKSENSDFNLLCLPTDNFPTFPDEFEGTEIVLNNSRFLSLLNKTKISISKLLEDNLWLSVATPVRKFLPCASVKCRKTPFK